MTNRTHIIGGDKAIGRKFGLIYTERCGWVDLGHANPKGASILWNDILNEKGSQNKRFSKYGKSGYFIVNYFQEMSQKRIHIGKNRSYYVKKGLNIDQKKSIALSIFLNVSHDFEGMQSNWLFRKVTDSGYSAEDLVSNLIGFYRAIFPSKPFIQLCKPVSKDVALGIWDKYGAVGSNKNYSIIPYLYPTSSSDSGGLRSMVLPYDLNIIKPAKQGYLFEEFKVKGISLEFR